MPTSSHPCRNPRHRPPPRQRRASRWALTALLPLAGLWGSGSLSGCVWDPSGLAPPPRDGGATDAEIDRDDAVADAGPDGATPDAAALCGDGLAQANEACDGTDLAGATCQSVTGHTEGVLSCTPQCTLVATACHTCGDTTVEGPEQCDGTALGQDCVGLGYEGGTLSCGQDCRFDESRCFQCGDGICGVDAGEGFDTCPADCNWARIDAGAHHTCGVRRDGTVWCWGKNDRGQVGDGTLTDRHVPTRVLLASPALDVSAGTDFSCARMADATVRCWGKNDRGQIGDGTVTDRDTPTPVPGLVDVRLISAGGAHACVHTANGQLLCWGKNDKGQLGDNSTTDRHGPVAVAATTGLAVAVWVTAGDKHTCAIDALDAAWCWGDKGGGRLGDGSGADQLEPARVSGASGLGAVLDLSAGDKHTCAVDLLGDTWCWGDKADGRLGDDTNTSQPAPVPVLPGAGLTTAVEVSAGGTQTCARRSDGVVFCWGKNDVGQLGDGTVTSRTTPVAVDPSTGLAQAAGLSAGGSHTVAWQANGDGWAWGASASGQLGDNATTDRSSPVEIVGN